MRDIIECSSDIKGDQVAEVSTCQGPLRKVAQFCEVLRGSPFSSVCILRCRQLGLDRRKQSVIYDCLRYFDHKLIYSRRREGILLCWQQPFKGLVEGLSAVYQGNTLLLACFKLCELGWPPPALLYFVGSKDL